MKYKTQKILEYINEQKMVNFKDVINYYDHDHPRAYYNFVKKELDFLVSKKLIKHFPASIEDFDRYTITAKGLNAGRLIKEKRKIEHKLEELCL